MANNPTDWLIAKLNSSPTPYHAVEQVKETLLQKGFKELIETEHWQLTQGGRYFVTRRNSSIIAFTYAGGKFAEQGFRIIGAHTDSPVLKLKPRPTKSVCGYKQVGIEVYGGALLAPWFDRDLSIAGRVSVQSESGPLHHLINFENPVAIIPSLAIHLDRAANEGRSISPQEHMNVVLGQLGEDEYDIKVVIADQLKKQGLSVDPENLLDWDLSLYDTQGASLVGLNQEFIASARLDNLLSCFAGLRAFIDDDVLDAKLPAVLALFDHEEVGSQSDVGARSNFLMSVLERLLPEREDYYRALRHSALISVDNAHGVHPNFRSKHDESHGPLINHGPVIKYDANQGYATSSQTALLVKHLAKLAGVPIQAFVMRADMRCGSTIGPMSSASAGLPTVDLGVATFAMHSIRELGGQRDFGYLVAILEEYLKTRSLSH